eukprot:CAMPEP_0177650246 /NCGR_PEP_ID=MMETSP0447-20121125/11834_1 /TAXON_ID=0 /ORGANISM="Stygamoeba regulata, Strain BSH-02190019" /LENGTH=82 /DNA_ID=CAMNT_0019153091 /DNA_START=59 /DNA_END=307 /DNA_ORIENTATION=+
MATPVELFGNTTDVQVDDPSMSVEAYLTSVCEAHVAQLLAHAEQSVQTFRERAKVVRVELANSNTLIKQASQSEAAAAAEST